MKISLTLALLGGCIFGAQGALQLRFEQEEITRDTENELLLLGATLRASLENALRDQQLSDVHDSVQIMDEVDPAVDLVIYDGAGHLVAKSASDRSGSLEDDSLYARFAGKQTMVAFEPSPDEPSHAIYVTPMALPPMEDDGPEAVNGTLLIVKPLTQMHVDLAKERNSILVGVLAYAFAVSLVGLVLGTAYVSRPLARLAAEMQKVRAGDFSASLRSPGNDEVGGVAAEFNQMVTELDNTRRRLAREAASRQALESALLRVDKLITVGQLSAGLAHDIGSPLQIINGRARLLTSLAEMPPEALRHAEIIVSQSERITTIVQQLLNYARRTPPKLLEQDLTAPIQQIVDLLEIDARRRGVEIVFTPAAHLLPVRADGEQVQQIVLNLLTNALRATPQGGAIRLRLALSSFELPGIQETRPSVAISVEDTGEGMDEEALKRLFEPFFTTWGESGGTGLGLAVVKSIVNAHRGVITVDSAIGKGTRFVVHFPLENSRMPAEVPA